ncbi:hypothetical protein KM043_011220 [Ampulex compressa]|nr:hypothetical protein KM043_011220 [Ampulex compressa]
MVARVRAATHTGLARASVARHTVAARGLSRRTRSWKEEKSMELAGEATRGDPSALSPCFSRAAKATAISINFGAFDHTLPEIPGLSRRAAPCPTTSQHRLPARGSPLPGRRAEKPPFLLSPA